MTNEQKIQFITEYIVKYNEDKKYFNSDSEIAARPVIMQYLHEIPVSISASCAKDLFLFASLTNSIEADTILLKKYEDFGNSVCKFCNGKRCIGECYE